MKIAIPTNGNHIDNHFGHSKHFTLIEVNGQQELINKEVVENTPICGCKSDLAGELEEKGVKLLLAGGIGQGAVQKLKNYQIEVIAGFTGTIDEVIEKWKSKDYEKVIKICTDHEHNCTH